jgi:two-component system chemotaxis response regulator CheY
MKMLILEDDFFHRKLMTRLLMQHGECVAVATGPDAVSTFAAALVEGASFDVVFLDIMVPGMDGQKVLRALREKEAEHGVTNETRSKIVMVTALSDKQNITTAYQESCDAYLIKPYDESKLIGTLQKLGVLQSKQSQTSAAPAPSAPAANTAVKMPVPPPRPPAMVPPWAVPPASPPPASPTGSTPSATPTVKMPVPPPRPPAMVPPWAAPPANPPPIQDTTNASNQQSTHSISSSSTQAAGGNQENTESPDSKDAT